VLFSIEPAVSEVEGNLVFKRMGMDSEADEKTRKSEGTWQHLSCPLSQIGFEWPPANQIKAWATRQK
jgi:hypothetical protein